MHSTGRELHAFACRALCSPNRFWPPFGMASTSLFEAQHCARTKKSEAAELQKTFKPKG